jgi:hypothetical protein
VREQQPGEQSEDLQASASAAAQRWHLALATSIRPKKASLASTWMSRKVNYLAMTPTLPTWISRFANGK